MDRKVSLSLNKNHTGAMLVKQVKTVVVQVKRVKGTFQTSWYNAALVNNIYKEGGDVNFLLFDIFLLLSGGQGLVKMVRAILGIEKLKSQVQDFWSKYRVRLKRDYDGTWDSERQLQECSPENINQKIRKSIRKYQSEWNCKIQTLWPKNHLTTIGKKVQNIFRDEN